MKRYTVAVLTLDFRAPGRPYRLGDLLARTGIPLAGRSLRAEIEGGGAIAIDAIVPPGARVRAVVAVADGVDGVDGGVDPPTRDRAPDPAGPARVLAPALPWQRGELREPGGVTRFEQTGRRGALAELRVEGGGGQGPLATLASAGFPVVGDFRRGGILAAGGLRWRAESEAANAAAVDAWWPDEPLWPEANADGTPPTLVISSGALRALERGHPWLRPDPGCGDAARFAPGTLVVLREATGVSATGPSAAGASATGPSGRDFGLALTDGSDDVAARVWGRGARRARDAPSVEARVARALAARRDLPGPAAASGPVTDVYRLVHGEADELPGLAVDRLGPVLRAVVSSRALEAWGERWRSALCSQLADVVGADPALVEVSTLRARLPGRFEAVRLARGRLAPGRVRVRERGLVFEVDPGLGRSEQPRPGFGLFPDMRENRERAARLAGRGGRWLNLFAHTGAFSAALLAGGADEVVSVDLSGPYLEWLERNLDLNGLGGPRHSCERGDGRRFLDGLPPEQRFAGIILDPPTAAAAGRRFFAVARDLAPLVESALARLEPGGWLLVARNDRTGGGGAERLAQLIRRAAGRTGVAIARVQDAPPGADFPRLSGFPEGDPFRAAWVERAR